MKTNSSPSGVVNRGLDRYNDGVTRILRLKGKYGEQYFLFSSTDQLLDLCKIILKKRYESKLYYHKNDNNFDSIKDAIKTSDGRRSFCCLRDRSDYEYEGFHILELSDSSMVGGFM